MILDRYYQWTVIVVAALYFWEHSIVLVLLLLPVVFVAIGVIMGLLLWHELNSRVGAAGPRGLLKLRWELSRSPGMLAERRRNKIARAMFKAYNLAPQTALDEQTERLKRLMQDAYTIDRRVPPIFQKRLTAEGIAKFLAEAEGLTGPPRTAFIDALTKAAPRKRHLGLLARVRTAIRRPFAWLAGSKLEHRRIGYVFSQVFFRGNASRNERLVSLVAIIHDARKAAGLEATGEHLFDPIMDLPLSTQRKLILISRVAFGNADMAKIALTDPSRFKLLRALKDSMDGAAVPERHLWDVLYESGDTVATSHSTAETTDTSAPNPEATEEELRAILESNAKEAVFLARTWPITGKTPGRSWLGGAPLLPKSMAWPSLTASQTPLHFLAQIDCSELPRVKGGEDMPEDGLLLFFAYISEEMLWEDDEGSTQVVYVPAPVIPDTPAPLPAGLPDIPRDPGHRSYPLWPVIPQATKSYFCDYDMPPKMHDLATAAQDAALAPFLPSPSESPLNRVFDESFLRDPQTKEIIKDKDGYFKSQTRLHPDLEKAGFPFLGAVINRFMVEYNSQIWKVIDSERSYKGYLERRLETAENIEAERENIRKLDAKIAELSKILADLNQLSDRLTTLGDFDRVPDREAQFFIQWLIQMRVQAKPEIDTALLAALKSLTQQAVIDPKMLAALPQELFDHFDAYLRPSVDQSEHMMLGHTQIRTNSTAGPGLRLLALDSDYGLNFMFCDGGMAEFWIDPKDLAERDFSRVVAFTAGG